MRRRAWTAALAVATGIACGLGLLHAAARPLHPATAPAARPPSPSPVSESSASVRARFGLRHDPAYVAMTLRDPHGDRGWLGIPLEPAEVRELERRERVGEALSVAQAHLGPAARRHSAGEWLDQEAGGVAVFATTDPSTLPASAVARWLPPGSRVRIRTVAHTGAELDGLARRVSVDAATVAWVRAAVRSVGTSPMENLVRVGVRPATSAATVDRLRARYGPAAVVETDPATLDAAPATP